jgi:serpin B
MKLSSEFNYTTVPLLDSQLIELPYVGNEIAMYVLLPNERDGIKSYKKLLNAKLLDEAIANMSSTTIRLALPKFKIETSYMLKQYLISLGIRHAFTYKSDLSGIDGTKYLHLSEVYHKAICEVNEEGSEATAATGLVVSSRGLFGRYRNVPTFKADHPFLFFIRHKRNGAILFAGYLIKPSNFE